MMCRLKYILLSLGLSGCTGQTFEQQDHDSTGGLEEFETGTTEPSEEPGSTSSVDLGPEYDQGAGIDDFFEDDLSLWSVLNPEAAALSIVDGLLQFEPAAHTVWYHETSGPLLWQLVEGDFIVTADVTSRRLSHPEQPPLPNYRTGGLMVRNPTQGAENYLFLGVGAEEFTEAAEVKNTIDDESHYQATSWPGAEGELRICRIGERFELLIREREGTWRSLEIYERADFPAALAVGPFAFAAQGDPDLRVSFDWVRFRVPTGAADCTK